MYLAPAMAVDTHATPPRASNENVKSSDSKAKGANRRLWGKLGTVMELPLDVLFEIFSNLLPGDLIRLSRTTKQFRRVLLNRSSTMVWRRARENVPGLPECPCDMTEPAYANLIYSPHCHFCLRPNIRSIDWVFRIRICGSCSKTQIKEKGSFYCFQDEVLTLIPTRVARRRGRRLVDIYLEKHYEQMDDMLSQVDHAQRKDFVAKVKSDLVAQLKHSQRCEEWTLDLAFDRSQEIAQLKRQRYEAIVARLEELGWKSELELSEAQTALSNFHLVKQSNKLTERVWANIKPSVITFMEDTRNKRLLRERSELELQRRRAIICFFKEYLVVRLARSVPHVMPKIADYLNFPQVKALIADASEAECRGSVLADFASEVPELLSNWRQKLDQDLITHVSSLLSATKENTSEEKYTGVGQDDSVRIIDLATTAYRCELCVSLGTYDPNESENLENLGASRETKVLFYPEVLDHPCNSLNPCVVSKLFTSRAVGTVDMEIQQTLALMLLPFKYPIHFRYLVLDQIYSSIARTLVELVGLLPEKATARDMDDLKTCFCCIPCYEEAFKSASARNFSFVEIPYCNWREMTTHLAEVHSEQVPDLQILPSKIFSQLKLNKISDLWIEDAENSPVAIWQCIHCLDHSQYPWRSRSNKFTHEAIGRHVRYVHDQLEPCINVDFFRSFDAPDRYPTPLRAFKSRKVLVANKRLLHPGQPIDFDAMLALF